MIHITIVLYFTQQQQQIFSKGSIIIFNISKPKYESKQNISKYHPTECKHIDFGSEHHTCILYYISFKRNEYIERTYPKII